MRFATIVTTAALALALAGCKKPAPEARESEVSNSLAQVPPDVEAPLPAQVAPVAPPVIADAPRTQPTAPPPRPAGKDEQISDDADAAGMTARLPEDRDTQPAEQKAEEVKEQK